MEPRRWKIVIPVRPKAVQSTRFDRGGFHADPKVRKWKEEIRRHIVAQVTGEPTKLPVRVTRIRYIYKAPQRTPKAVLRYIEAGGEVPYLVAGDLTDNLSKGVIDVCKGIVFEDDLQVVRMDNVMKLYGLDERIELEFEELVGMTLIDGEIAGGPAPDGMLI